MNVSTEKAEGTETKRREVRMILGQWAQVAADGQTAYTVRKKQPLKGRLGPRPPPSGTLDLYSR